MPSSSPQQLASLHLGSLLRGSGDVKGEGEVSVLELVRDPVHEGEAGSVETIELQGPARWRASVSSIGGDEFWLNGRVAGTALVECSRCLRPTPVPVDARLETLMRFDAKAETPRLEYGEDDQEVIVFSNPALDLAPFLAEAFALELPLIVLHSPDCRGLCAACGADLNGVEPGTCAVSRTDDCPNIPHDPAEDPDNPFARLKGLIKD